MTVGIPSAVLPGVDGRPVSVEVHITNGPPDSRSLVCRFAARACYRIRTALTSSRPPWPRRRVTVTRPFRIETWQVGQLVHPGPEAAF